MIFKILILISSLLIIKSDLIFNPLIMLKSKLSSPSPPPVLDLTTMEGTEQILCYFLAGSAQFDVIKYLKIKTSQDI
jgi:hypothetical protein